MAPDRKKCCSVLQKSIHLATGIFTIVANDSAVIPALILLTCSTKMDEPWDSSISSVESFFDLYGRSEEKYLHCLAELSALLKERIHSPKASLLTEEFLKDYGNASFHSGLDCTI